MSVFGLAEQEVTGLTAAVRRGATAREDAPPADAAAIAEAFARASWCVIAEPADELAGLVVEAMGASAALEAVIEGASPARLSDAVNSALGVGTATASQLETALARWLPRASSRNACRAIEQAARFDCSLVVPADVHWPHRLDDLGRRRPHALWVRGSLDAGEGTTDAVAIVGARAATGYGEHVAAEFAAGLVDRGATVVSGGAYGIDGAAHRAALASAGRTVAVLAGGLDRFYPAGHEALLRRVAQTGAVIAEVPCGTPPTRFRFLQRNRLIAALADSVVVVEAGARSGSLNTAGHAAEIGRPIGAVPGPITSASSAGCHRLLREFPATCVTTVGEVLALHRGDAAPDALPGFDRRSLEELQVLDALRPRQGRDAGELARLSGLAEREVLQVLGRLELEGAVTRGDRGWVRARM